MVYELIEMKLRIFDRASGFSGYSRNISGLAMALLDLGVDVKVIQEPTTEYIPDKLKPHVIFGFDKGVQEIDKETIVMGRTFAGIEGLRAYNPKMICSILVLEGDRIPEEWVARANMIDQVWASSSYNKEMLIKNGVACDIQVIWHGFDQEVYYSKWGDINAKVKEISEEGLNLPFTFGFCGGHTNPVDRKGGQWVAEAFNIFTKEDNVRLKFHINKSYNPSFDAEGHLRSLIKPELQDKVEYDDSFMTDKELADWYRSLDVSVTPSMGEAFCMSILESMACGTPVVVTSHSGYLDYTIPAGQFHVNVKKKVLAHYGMFDVPAGSVWVEPDVEHLMEIMYLCCHSKTRMEQTGKQAAEYVHAKLTWEKQARKTIEAIQDFQGDMDAIFKRMKEGVENEKIERC